MNLANPANSFKFDKQFTCKSFYEGEIVDINDQKVLRELGIYCIICTKPTCEYRGVIYFGETQRVRSRLGDHVDKINNENANDRQKVHRHFHEHEDVDSKGNPWPTKHLKVALIQEVTTGKKDRKGKMVLCT